MKTTILKKTTLFLIPVLALSACNDDDMLMGDSASQSNEQVSVDGSAMELISMLQSNVDANVAIGGITISDVNNDNGVQVYYFEPNQADKELYRQAYEKGQYFLVSERNSSELNEILGRELQVEFGSNKVNGKEYSFQLSEYDSSKEYEEFEPVVLSCDSASIECKVEDVECDHYMLFNKNATMVVDIPMYESVPDGMVESIVDFINEDNTPIARSNSTDQLVVATLKRSLVKKYTYTYKKVKIHENKQTVNVNYTISSCYSANEDRDYYMLEQEVILFNGELKTKRGEIKIPDGSKWTIDESFYGYIGYSRGAYLKAVFGAENESKLSSIDNNTYFLEKTSPATTEGSKTTSEGVNLTLNGQISYGKSSITTGVTLTSSHTMCIPDVTVTNNCGTRKVGHDNRYAEWKFEIAWPYSRFKFWSGSNNWKIDDVVTVGKSTCELYTSNIWSVKNPKKGYNPTIGVAVSSNTGMTGGSFLWGKKGVDFHQEINNEEWMKITFAEPYRGE